jgi:hypothetical protein
MQQTRLAASYVVLPDHAPCLPFMLDLDYSLEAEVSTSASLVWGVFAHDWRQVPLGRHLDPVPPSVGVVVDDVPALRPMSHNAFESAHRTVHATYLQGAVTQEAAASRLGIPYSTYSRHLSTGTALLCDRLWSQQWFR